ncbi:MAG: T9SS type A sorting domain-containing protein, partial [Chitinophagales bacterium]|nr:T9SS type A sorting domain-containing protein [Chitinophagales bacterium]
DINGDGNMDVLVASAIGTNISWFRNEDGQGNFGFIRTITTQASWAQSVHAADLDGDGDMDVLSASRTDDKIAWYENEDSNGNFGDQIIISTLAEDAQSVYAADLDGDGDMDVLSASEDDSKIAWYENEDGIGNFGEQNIINDQATEARDVYAADLDGDGDMDVISASNGMYKVAWYENEDSNGNFSTPIDISSEVDKAVAVSSADLDGDGDMDVISVSTFDSRVAWYENENGNAHFGNPIIISTQAVGATSVYAGDLDNDGDIDALSASRSDNRIAWYENEDGNGTFGNQKIINTELIGPRAVHAADLDGDGDLDVLSASKYDDKIMWYENEDGNGGFGNGQVITIEAEGARDVYTADLDGDNDLDVLSASMDDNKIAWYENEDGNGNFSDPHVITTLAEGARAVYAADLDGDGDMDVLSASRDDDKIAWYENEDGNGTFGSSQIISTLATSAYDVYAADLDGDNDIDVISSSLGSQKIAWYRNEDGNGSFSNSIPVHEELYRASAVYATDIDIDGDLDILVAIGDRIVWHKNEDGNGNFGDQLVISNQAEDAISVFAANIDGAGGIDVLSASSTDNKIAWYRNLYDLPTLSGTCFYDANENQIKDQSEVGLFNHVLNLEPEALLRFTNANGDFTLFVDNGTYLLQPDTPENWSITTDSTSYTIDISDNIFQDLNFGFFPDTLVTAIQPFANSSATRCGFEVPFWINYENVGTTVATGYVAFALDTLTSLVSVSPQPDSIENNTLFWSLNQFSPFSHDLIQLLIQMPGVEYIGTSLSFQTIIYLEDENGNLLRHTIHSYEPTLNCAYDPNDKLVFPEGIDEEHYTLLGEELIYTVRFQNTGTDTAFTVRIEDQLDENLDWATFRPITASHPFEATLLGNGKVEFLFKNILLPDSTTNEPESHGFITYKIKHREGLPDDTQIFNTADIFFDFNPPIQTNTTLNTFVTELPTNSSSFTSPIYIKTYPNPFSAITYFEFGDLPFRGEKHELIIRDVHGKALLLTPVHAHQQVTVKGDKWSPGIYFYQLKTGNTILTNGKIVKIN